MNSKVSVITPFYNSSRYLAESIESVQSQTYENWELILVNDGSSDDSVAIVETYTKSDPRVLLVNYDVPGNKGKSHARNLGIDNATGAYTTFLDSDDIFLPTKLSVKLNIFNHRTDIDMVLGNTIYWKNWLTGHENLPDFYPEYLIEPNNTYRPGALIKLMMGSAGAVPCICSFIVKTNMLKKVGAFNDGFLNLYEDQALITKLLLSSNIYLSDSYFEKYRQRIDSDWHRSVSTGEDKRVAKIYRNWMSEILENHPSVSKNVSASYLNQNPSLLHKFFIKLKSFT